MPTLDEHRDNHKNTCLVWSGSRPISRLSGLILLGGTVTIWFLSRGGDRQKMRLTSIENWSTLPEHRHEESSHIRQNHLIRLGTTSTKREPISSLLSDTFSVPEIFRPLINGTMAPVLIQKDNAAWTKPTLWSENQLTQKLEAFPQYLKDLKVQPYMDSKHNDLCVVTTEQVIKVLLDEDVLFFTNNQENDEFMTQLRPDYTIPEFVRHINGFEVFSAMATNHSHSFHAHGESWLGQVEGRRQWWFAPPTAPAPKRVNACLYLQGETPLPNQATISFVQHPGDIVWFPKGWYHATCALDRWTVGIGWQQGNTIRQQFPKLRSGQTLSNVDDCLKRSQKPASGASASPKTEEIKDPPSVSSPEGDREWKWFNGDLNAYYNSLTTDESQKRNPNEVNTYAVHRWLGNPKNTAEHYQILYDSIEKHLLFGSSSNVNSKEIKLLDAGCGLGAGLMWMEQKAPHWNLTGYTISEEQHKFITQSLPTHRFHSKLQTFDDLSGEDESQPFHVIYSIEALIHSKNITATLLEWVDHLAPGGAILLIDDFLAPYVNKNSPELQDFVKSWLANSLVSIEELRTIGRSMGLELVEDRDLVEEYKIIERNYQHKKPAVQPVGGRTHQGWMGSKWRQRLTVEGKLMYNLVALKKDDSNSIDSVSQCTAVPNAPTGQQGHVPEILPQLMSGRGKDGGQAINCISGWYCCNKGSEWYETMAHNRTEKKVEYLHLDQALFGHYMDVFVKHLNDHYQTYPMNATGKFLDIGGTGSTASGMQQVTSKFQNFVGPLEYWKLDSDPAAETLERTLYCDVDDCSKAEPCSFDVTFSHTVLEHSQRPWLAFDTIARITKMGGLTLHLVPWSYQYHATPGDHFRFSHTGLKALLEDRGFAIMEVGYDICTKQENKKTSVDEHYDAIWLTYIVGRKLW